MKKAILYMYVFCAQLTKTEVAEMSCSQLSLTESATYMIEFAMYMLKMNSLAINNVARSL